VTPSAKIKDRFIIVDAVGVCEQDKTDSHTLNRRPSKTLEQVLEYVAQGGTDQEALTTLASRLARLQREFTAAQLAELRDLAGGKSFPDLAHELLNACNRDVQIEAAKQQFAVAAPSDEQTKQATARSGCRHSFPESRVPAPHLGNPSAERTNHRSAHHRRRSLCWIRCCRGRKGAQQGAGLSCLDRRA
jgi:hypothetical protein